MIRLALPVIATYLGFTLMGVVDIIFVGHVSAEAIGAVGVGTAIYVWAMMFGLGLLAGLDYLVSYAQGAGTPEEGYRALVQSLLVTSWLAIPLTAALVFMAFHLDWLGVNPAVAVLARPYLIVLSLSLWPQFVFNALRQHLTAQGIANPAMVILIGANLLNAFLNWVLIFGVHGTGGTELIPAMGSTGSAFATLVSRIAMLVAMVVYWYRWDRRHQSLFARIPFRREPELMRRFLHLGIPSALHMTFEVGVFAISTALAARLKPADLAAHQIVLNIASFTFMVPLGLSAATSVLVGQALGGGSFAKARRMGWRGLAVGAGFMTASAIALYTFGTPILSIFASDAAVTELATSILIIAALFQISDGIQVVAAGALRGIGDTRSPMLCNLIGHWAIGLPIGVYLCFSLGKGLPGIWIGLSLGLTSVAASLLAVWKLRVRPSHVNPTPSLHSH